MASKVLRHLDQQLASTEPGSLRHETLAAAKQFKSSWVELGARLFTVSKEKAYRAWGYLTFEAYCAKELHLRAATAKKLLQSYYFLEKEEPTALERIRQEAPEASLLPSPDAVNMLRLLKKREEVPAERYQQVRHYVLEEGKEPSEIRQHVQAILKSSRPETEEAQTQRRTAAVRRMIGTLRSLHKELDDQGGIPKKLMDQISALAENLEKLAR